MGKNIGTSNFFHDFNNFDKNGGWRGELFCFIELYKYVSRTLKQKLRVVI